MLGPTNSPPACGALRPTRRAALRSLVTLCGALLLGAPCAVNAQEVLLPGTFLAEGLSIDLTRAGIARPVELMVEALPPELIIGTTPGQELINLLLCREDLQVQNLVVNTWFETATVSASASGMFLDIDMNVRVNSGSDPAWVILDGCFDFECFLYTDPATLIVELPINLQLLPGQQRVDLQLGPLNQNIGWIIENKVHFGGCALIDINNYLIQNWGLDLIDFVIDELISTLEGELTGMLAEAEVAVEEALLELWQADVLEVGDAQIAYAIEPTAVEHTNAGLRLQMGGVVEPLQMHPCVDAYDPGGSPWTPSQIPELQGVIPGSMMGYDASVVLSDDLPNQALWALWRAGALCFEAAEIGGQPLNTTLLGVIVGEDLKAQMEEIVGEAGPVTVRVVPERIPQVHYDGDWPIRLEAPELHVEFWSTVLDREVRLAAITGDLVGALDASIDPTGALVFDMSLLNGELRQRTTYNEFFRDSDEALANSLPGLIDLAVGSLLGIELTGGVAPMPTLLGYGLDSLWMEPSGELEYAPDHVGLYVTMGPSDGGGDIQCSGPACEALDGCALAEGGCAMAEGGCGGGDGLLGGGGCEMPEGGEGCNAQDLAISSGCSGTLGTSTDEGCRHAPPKVRVGMMDALVVMLALLWRRRRR